MTKMSLLLQGSDGCMHDAFEKVIWERKILSIYWTLTKINVFLPIAKVGKNFIHSHTPGLLEAIQKKTEQPLLI